MSETAIAVQEPEKHEVIVIEPPHEELQLIAETPGEMAIAQQKMKTWCSDKITAMKAEAAELTEEVRLATEHKWKTSVLKRHESLALKRVDFYEKIQVAVESGYCIVPNFPVQTFAIRTRKRIPSKKEGTWEYDSRLQSSESPPLGEGEYKDSVPLLDWKHVSDGIDEKTGKTKWKKIWYADSFEEQIEFPISVAKPQIMTATQRAMLLKCFDDIGVLPDRVKVSQDPLVIGRIKDPRSSKFNQKYVSFLIAWYVDTSVL